MILNFTNILFLVFYPSRTFTFSPNALAFCPISLCILSFTILPTVFPTACIRSPICPGISSLTMFFILFVFPLKFSTIFPSKNTLSVHFTIQPLTIVLSSIRPSITACLLAIILICFYLVIIKKSFILRSIFPYKQPWSMFLIILIISLKNCAVNPSFFTVAMLFIFKPTSFVNTPIIVLIFSISMSFHIYKIALIIFTFRLNQTS